MVKDINMREYEMLLDTNMTFRELYSNYKAYRLTKGDFNTDS